MWLVKNIRIVNDLSYVSIYCFILMDVFISGIFY